MFRIKNICMNSYLVMHSCFNGVSRVHETVNVKLAKTFPKKEALSIIAKLHLNCEFKQYSVEKVQ